MSPELLTDSPAEVVFAALADPTRRSVLERLVAQTWDRCLAALKRLAEVADADEGAA